MAVLATSVTSLPPWRSLYGLRLRYHFQVRPDAIESAYRSVICPLGGIGRSPVPSQTRSRHLMTEWATPPRIFSSDAVCSVSQFLTEPAGGFSSSNSVVRIELG